MGVRLSRLLVQDPEGSRLWQNQKMMRQVAREVQSQETWALPRHMQRSLQGCAYQFERSGDWIHYAQMCLFAVQERPAGEPAPVIHLRRELEDIFFFLIYGSHP